MLAPRGVLVLAEVQEVDALGNVPEEHEVLHHCQGHRAERRVEEGAPLELLSVPHVHEQLVADGHQKVPLQRGHRRHGPARRPAKLVRKHHAPAPAGDEVVLPGHLP
eukprot:CAMPEP_0118952830 /NCGR_PEP_ID=MMETSP1169-20130426/55538_1 /TAXON_ID=36882 /ORGANISM="Pyramimonas obovata, Strain CCMP722" /LENGTH=106 /DNA_ID=CAMNT_0006900165 /DNA_START=65 /DNA_END=381 /DNA_ORIENTATION=+